MATYLLTWNPQRFDWFGIDEEIADLEASGWLEGSWTCGQNKSLKPGDRFYLIRLGYRTLNKGIVGSGVVTSEPYLDEHWQDQAGATSASARFVDVRFDALLNAEFDKVLEIDILKSDPILRQMHWSSQTSGIRIPEAVAEELQKRWSAFLEVGFLSPQMEELGILDGVMKEVRFTTYERNATARRQCIEIHGSACAICGFDFARVYGPVGANFIHVHHITPLADAGGAHRVNPAVDLIPVCPNCHAIIHRRTPCYSIEEMRTFLTANQEDSPESP